MEELYGPSYKETKASCFVLGDLVSDIYMSRAHP